MYLVCKQLVEADIPGIANHVQHPLSTEYCVPMHRVSMIVLFTPPVHIVLDSGPIHRTLFTIIITAAKHPSTGGVLEDPWTE